jgi:phosphoglycolate phosphatase-like HAD superfamily hydrolase
MEPLLEEVRPLPHARELLEQLRTRPVKVVLASSGKAAHTRRWIEMLDADEPGREVDDVTTGGDGRTKPDPELIDKAVDAVDGDTALVVGDSVWDAEAARRRGARMAGLLTGGFGRDELEEAGATVVCENVAELIDRLDDVLAGVLA